MKIDKDVRFATVPEWLIFADVSAYAVRIWAVLDRRSDGSTGTCEVSLSTIARLGRCSVNTVKKALVELEALGAIDVERDRMTASGDPDTNRYLLRTSDPSSRDGGRSDRDPPGGSSGDPGVGHDVALKERKQTPKAKPKVGLGFAAKTSQLLTFSALEETSAFSDLDDDVKAELQKIRKRHPDFPVAQLAEAKWWREIDAQSEHHDVFYLDELWRYVEWWALQPRGSRHRNVKRAFGRWWAKEISRSEWRRRNGPKAQRIER
jgi:hypothetical protein